MGKQCSKCKRTKPLGDFFNASRYRDGKYPSCKSCQKIATKKSVLKKWGTMGNYYSEYRNRITGGNPSIIYTKKKCNALKHNVVFTLTREEFIEWYDKQNKKCHYCGIDQAKITLNQDMMPNINIHRLTLDRLNPKKGYEKGNVVLCCSRCNLIKNNFFSEKEMLEIAEKYVKNKWKN